MSAMAQDSRPGRQADQRNRGSRGLLPAAQARPHPSGRSGYSGRTDSRPTDETQRPERRRAPRAGWPPTGRGISRIPRVKGERSRRAGQAAGVASVVGGRLPHPPRSEKVIYSKINKKEKKLALETAIAFTGDANAVAWRGHRAGTLKFPLVVSDDIESISKTSELHSFFEKVGPHRRAEAPLRRSEEAVGQAEDARTRLQGADRAAHRRQQRQRRRQGGRGDPRGQGRHGGQPQRPPPSASRRRGEAHILDGIVARRAAAQGPKGDEMKVEA